MALAELRAEHQRDVQALAAASQETLPLSTHADDLARLQAALVDAQESVAALLAERDDARRDAQHAHQQRHAFLAGLAHDLRNPLAPLSNGLELLRLTDHDAAGRLRTRGILERQVTNLLRIADELSDLARLTGANAALQHAPFALDAVLSDLGERVRALLQAQEMTLVVGPGSAGLPSLHGDAQRLGQALAHLVNDIARHSEHGSAIVLSVRVEAGVIALQLATAADADGTPAVAPEAVDPSALGLGVAVAAQLVALHGGRLLAQRPAGARRARFAVTLPIEGEATPALPAPVAPAAAGPGALSVLLADDNIDFSHSFGTMLELLGHRVDLVHDGLAAVAAIVAAPPDIAFVDIGMPALDGLEAVRRVRGQGHTQDVLLVAVTGRGGAEDRARAAEAGFDRYLVKPFAMQDVRDALDAAQAIRGGTATRVQGGFTALHST